MDFRKFTLEEVNALNHHTLMETLSINCIELGNNLLKFRMPVDARTHQPMGLLHGGASAALVETVGSFGSYLMCDLEKEKPVGIEISVQHVKAIRIGFVIATGNLIHNGATIHIWNVEIHDENSLQLIASGKLTIMRVKKKL